MPCTLVRTTTTTTTTELDIKKASKSIKKASKIKPVYLTFFIPLCIHFRRFVCGLYVFRINKVSKKRKKT